jgi:type II secretory pathway pseudopilin PulG
MKKSVKTGFAIIEILIAISILSIILIAIITGVSSGIVAISGNQNLTRAMIIANSKLNEFQMMKLRGTDIDQEPIQEYPGFFYSRKVERFEHELFGPIDAKRVVISIIWKERDKDRNYTISLIYPPL